MDNTESRDAREEALCVDDVFADMYAILKDPFRYTFILTGKFGREFLMWMNRSSKPYAGYIVYPGGMSDGKARQYEFINIKTDKNYDWTQKAVFVDASITQGKTRDACLMQLQVPKTLLSLFAYTAPGFDEPWAKSLQRR